MVRFRLYQPLLVLTLCALSMASETDSKADDSVIEVALDKFVENRRQEIDYVTETRDQRMGSLHGTSQGIHASFNKPNPDALKTAEVSYWLEIYTRELEKKKEMDSKSEATLFRWRRQWPDFITRFFSSSSTTTKTTSQSSSTSSSFSVITGTPINLNRILPRIRGAVRENHLPSALVMPMKMDFNSNKDFSTDFADNVIKDIPDNNIFENSPNIAAIPDIPDNNAFAAIPDIPDSDDIEATPNIPDIPDKDSFEAIPDISDNGGFDAIPDIPEDEDDDLDIPGCNREELEQKCNGSYQYRTFSGRCNNLAHSKYGKHTIPFLRLLPNAYADGISRPREKSVLSGPLPNVRAISRIVHGQKINEPRDNRYSLLLMQWGQYLDHDITLTPMARGVNSTILDCERCDSNRHHTACYPILVPTGDDYFPIREERTGQRKCIPFTRSLPGQQIVGPREQLNQNTAYIDASTLYGSDPCRVEELRSFKGGELWEHEHPKSTIFKGLLPTIDDNLECRSMLGICFHAGDDRNNEQPGLTSLHTLFLREHNRIAQQLSAINDEWTDEKIFQETRKIMMAINQHISYSEFLPRVLGELTKTFELDLMDDGEYFTGYDENCSPDIVNEFATAAFRFGHSLISPMFSTISNTKQRLPKAVKLSDHFNNPDVVYTSHFIDHLMRGMFSQPMEKFDGSVTEELTNHLFEEKGRPFSGMDLAALNIQRGRDHGLPGYTKYREFCQKKINGKVEEIKTFESLAKAIGVEGATKLSKVYRHVDDIDLFSGGLSELPLSGGIVGETFGCILGEQFRKLRACDRFWYETEDPLLKFSTEQLREIKKVTLASLVCNNCDVPSLIPRMAFDMFHNETNPLMECEKHPKLNIEFWRETRVAVSQQERSREGRVSGKKIDKMQNQFCEFDGRVILRGQKVRTSACVECHCSEKRECLTLKVDDACQDLVTEVGLEAVKLDSNCNEQCR